MSSTPSTPTTSTIPARLLLQIREGQRHNVLLEFDLRTRRQIDNPDGTHDHEVAVSSIASGLAAALRKTIADMGSEAKTVEWLRELRDWTFAGVAS